MRPTEWKRGYRAGPRLIAATSLTLGLFWTIGVIADELFDYDPSPVPFLIILMLVVAAISYGVLSARPDALRFPPSTGFWHLTGGFLRRTALCYLALVPICCLLGYLLVQFGWPNPDHSQAGLFVLLLGLWLPLWWAPGFAMVWSWLRSH